VIAAGTTGEGATRDLLAALRAGAIKTILVADGADLERTPVGKELLAQMARVPTRIVLASRSGEATGLATIVLPLAMWAERDGTLVSGDGRLQRFARAIEPPGDARPAFWVFLSLLGLLGKAREEETARQVFRWLASEVPALAGLGYDRLGPLGIDLASASARVPDGAHVTA
jgi:predicted molibdopterin-dependent oxidoreductase YjgC